MNSFSLSWKLHLISHCPAHPSNLISLHQFSPDIFALLSVSAWQMEERAGVKTEEGESVADASKSKIAVTGGTVHADFTRLVLCIRLSDCVVGFKCNYV